MGRIQDSNWPSCVPTITPRSPATVKGSAGWVGREMVSLDSASGKAGIWACAVGDRTIRAAGMRSLDREFIGGQFSGFEGIVHLHAEVAGSASPTLDPRNGSRMGHPDGELVTMGVMLRCGGGSLFVCGDDLYDALPTWRGE